MAKIMLESISIIYTGKLYGNTYRASVQKMNAGERRWRAFVGKQYNGFGGQVQEIIFTDRFSSEERAISAAIIALAEDMREAMTEKELFYV